MRSIQQLCIILALSISAFTTSAMDSSRQQPSSSRFWGFMFDQFSGESEGTPSQQHQPAYEHYTPTTMPTTRYQGSVPSMESLANRKEEFLALDNEGKAAFLQRVLAARTGQQVPTITSATAHPTTLPSTESLADRKAAFLALDNDAKIDFLQRAMAAKGPQQAASVTLDASLTPAQRKEAFLKLPTAAKIAYLRNMAASSGNMSS